MVGANFGENPLLKLVFLLVFIFDFSWYKKNTQNYDNDLNFSINFIIYFGFLSQGVDFN